jgi:hypothetical protein
MSMGAAAGVFVTAGSADSAGLASRAVLEPVSGRAELRFDGITTVRISRPVVTSVRTTLAVFADEGSAWTMLPVPSASIAIQQKQNLTILFN